jgi:negative regulator of replication initiation
MHRTQIYFDDEIFSYLEKEKKSTHQSYSEIIRNNIKLNIRKKTKEMILKMENAVGSWKNKAETPEHYIRNIRKDRHI